MDKNNIFPKISVFKNLTLTMQKRMLVEFVMIRKCIQARSPIPLKEIIDETGLNFQGKSRILTELLQAVAQNNVVIITHQDLYSFEIGPTTHVNITLECEPFLIKKWAKNAGLTNVYSFDYIKEDIKNIMSGELTEKINHMKSLIKETDS